KELILKTLNGMRNDIARGGYDGFMPAARMATMQWDDELAYVAKFNVLQCRMHHDPCRNTQSYKNVGQTVAYREVRQGRGATTDNAILRMIKLWFKEHVSATMADVGEYKGRQGRPKENFNQLMLENAQKVGCSAVLRLKNGWLKWFFTCNYAHSPTIGKPIYEFSANAGSACKTGINSEYENLCSVEESYDE
ncbi:hypothetical protein KR093_007251, partial [Drosophila rubida]